MKTYIQMLSATPPSRPNKHFRRVSSWLNFKSWSLDIFGVSLLPRRYLEGEFVMDFCRIRS